MHEPHLTEPRRVLTYSIDPGAEFRSVRVRAVSVDDYDLRAKGNFIAEDAQKRPAFHNPASERVLGLESDDEHRISWI